ncbi:unnamed protein product, partial [Symbiodinium pilosum]
DKINADFNGFRSSCEKVQNEAQAALSNIDVDKNEMASFRSYHKTLKAAETHAKEKRMLQRPDAVRSVENIVKGAKLLWGLKNAAAQQDKGKCKQIVQEIKGSNLVKDVKAALLDVDSLHDEAWRPYDLKDACLEFVLCRQLRAGWNRLDVTPADIETHVFSAFNRAMTEDA